MKVRVALALIPLACLVAFNVHSVAEAQGVDQQVQALNARVTVLTGAVSALEAQVATLQADDAAAKANVATLQTAVSKLDGDITAADLVGTYSAAGFQTELDPFVASGPTPAMISSSSYAASFTFNADGTGSFQGIQSGWTLVTGSGSVNADSGTGPPKDYTWTYSSGIVTLTLTGGEQEQLIVGAGGRVLFNAATGTDHTTSLFVATRL